MIANKKYYNTIRELNEASVEELLSNYKQAEFLNYTLESGRMGYALLFLYQYDKKQDERCLQIAKDTVFKEVYINNNNITLYYGLAGVTLVQLYYYYLTDDPAVLDIIRSNIEKVISHVKMMPRKHFMNAGFKDGLSGILYLYTLLQYSNEKVLFERMLLLLNQYLSEYLKSGTNLVASNEIALAYAIVEKYTFTDNLLLLKENMKIIQQNYPGERRGLENDLLWLFEHILSLASAKQVTLSLDINDICKDAIQQFFPRTVEAAGDDYDYSNHFGYSCMETLLNFCNSFGSENEIGRNYFMFEKAKFFYELELRALPPQVLIKKNNDEVHVNIYHLCLADDEFLKQYFKCSDDVRIVETKYYKTLEIEEDILEAGTYAVALKPRTTPFNELRISECCLEDSFKLIVHFNNMQEPARGQDLVEIAYEQDESIDYRVVRDFVASTLRKLVLYRLLTIENAETEKL